MNVHGCVRSCGPDYRGGGGVAGCGGRGFLHCIACSGMENLGRWWETSGGARHLRPPCHGAADDDCWPAPKVGVLLVDTGTPLGASFMGSLHCGAPAPIVAGHRFSSCQVSPAGRVADSIGRNHNPQKKEEGTTRYIFLRVQRKLFSADISYMYVYAFLRKVQRLCRLKIFLNKLIHFFKKKERNG